RPLVDHFRDPVSGGGVVGPVRQGVEEPSGQVHVVGKSLEIALLRDAGRLAVDLRGGRSADPGAGPGRYRRAPGSTGAAPGAALCAPLLIPVSFRWRLRPRRALRRSGRGTSSSRDPAPACPSVSRCRSTGRASTATSTSTAGGGGRRRPRRR